MGTDTFFTSELLKLYVEIFLSWTTTSYTRSFLLCKHEHVKAETCPHPSFLKKPDFSGDNQKIINSVSEQVLCTFTCFLKNQDGSP